MVSSALQALDDLVSDGVFVATELANDPLSALEEWDAVAVRRLPRSDFEPAGTTDNCSVAGTYYEGTPPIIAVAESASAGRNAFTALHELGHHLQRNTAALADELAELDIDLSFIVEDEVCNRFAAAVLIPAATADAVFGSGSPTAGDVVELASRTSASRSAVSVRAGLQLKTPGLVVLLDPEDNVQFASRGNLPPPRRGTAQGTIPLVRKARARQADDVTNFRLTDDDFRFIYRDEIEGESLYAQVADIGDGYLVIVAVDSKPPWKDGFTAPRYPTGPRAKTRICPHPECSEPFTTWAEAHDVCGEPICTSCNRRACSVSRVKERTCERCFTVQPTQLFPGEADICEACT